MNAVTTTDLNNKYLFGEVIHNNGKRSITTMGFGSCCCCSSSAAVFVEDEE